MGKKYERKMWTIGLRLRLSQCCKALDNPALNQVFSARSSSSFVDSIFSSTKNTCFFSVISLHHLQIWTAASVASFSCLCTGDPLICTAANIHNFTRNLVMTNLWWVQIMWNSDKCLAKYLQFSLAHEIIRFGRYAAPSYTITYLPLSCLADTS